MFQKALGFIKGIFSTASVVAPLLALFGVAFPPAAIAVIPMAIGLMTAAEDALGDGSGPLKKEAVTAGVAGFAEKMKEISTGGQKETWDAMTPEVVSVMIDTIATVANQVTTAAQTSPMFDDSVFDIAAWEARKY